MLELVRRGQESMVVRNIWLDLQSGTDRLARFPRISLQSQYLAKRELAERIRRRELQRIVRDP